MSAVITAQQAYTSPTAENTADIIITVPDGSNQIALLVGALSSPDGAHEQFLTSKTFDGNTMDQWYYTDFSGNSYSMFAFARKLPGAGSKTLHLEWAGGGAAGRLGSIVYIVNGVDQTLLHRTLETASAASKSGLATQVDDLLIDVCASDAITTPSSPGSLQTAHLAEPIYAGHDWGNVASSDKTAESGSESMSWGVGFSGTIRYLIIPLIPADPGGGMFQFFSD